MDQGQPVTMEQWIEHVGETLRRQEFMLRALTAEVERLRQLNPDPEQVAEGRPGETRGKSTAYRLPDGWGSLVVTIAEGGTAILRYQNVGHNEKLQLQLRKH